LMDVRSAWTLPQSAVAAAAAAAAAAVAAAAAAAAATAAAAAAAAIAGRAQSTSTFGAWSSDHAPSLERVGAITRQRLSPSFLSFEGRGHEPRSLPGRPAVKRHR
jgi:hypothetical protein